MSYWPNSAILAMSIIYNSHLKSEKSIKCLYIKHVIGKKIYFSQWEISNVYLDDNLT